MSTEHPVVVAILSHRDPVMLQRLVSRVLEGERTVALVHHDPRGGDPGLTPSERVLLVPAPQPCDWGRMSLATAVLRCMEAAEQQVPDLSWFLLVSGQDYPAMPMRRMEQILAATDADAMLRHFRVDPRPGADIHHWQAVCRRRYLRRLRIPRSHRSVAFPRRHPFRDGTELFIGDMWVNLSAAAVRHVLAQRARLPKIESYFARCSVPDEALLPTLLLNDSAGMRVDPVGRRFIKWRPDQPHPELLTPADVPAIIGSGDFFARKVDSARTPEVLDLLDAAAMGEHVPDGG